METIETELKYFLVVDGEKRGPFPLDDLIDAGMRFETPVWWEGLESWPLAGKIPKLNALLKAEQRRRIAVRRAERLPEPEPIRRLGWLSVLANVPAAAMFFLSGSALLTALVLVMITDSPAGPAAAPPSPVMMRTTWGLIIGGAAGTVLGLPLFILEAVFIGRLVWQCRAVVLAAAPNHKEDRASLGELAGDLTELGNVDVGGPSLPTFELNDLFMMLIPRYGLLGGGCGAMGGASALMLTLAIVGGSVCLMVGPALFCLLRPQMLVRMIILAVVMAVYLVIHVPVVATLLASVNRTGYGLNHVKDTYRLKVPWAPIGLSYWTSMCGMLVMAGPFSLLFFIFLAIWARKTSEVAAQICDVDSRNLIATPLPPKLPPEAKSAPKIEVL
jgi:hypothetical protein